MLSYLISVIAEVTSIVAIYNSINIGNLIKLLPTSNAGASAWIDWNLWLDVGPVLDGYHFGPSHYNPVPDTGGNNAMLVVDGVSGEVWPQAFYWHMGHISRFVLPGASVLATVCDASANINPAESTDTRQGRESANGSTSSLSLHCLSARNPDNTIAVVVQNPYNTSVQASVILSQRARAVNLDLPPRSIHTILFPA